MQINVKPASQRQYGGRSGAGLHINNGGSGQSQKYDLAWGKESGLGHGDSAWRLADEIRAGWRPTAVSHPTTWPSSGWRRVSLAPRREISPEKRDIKIYATFRATCRCLCCRRSCCCCYRCCCSCYVLGPCIANIRNIDWSLWVESAGHAELSSSFLLVSTPSDRSHLLIK